MSLQEMLDRLVEILDQEAEVYSDLLQIAGKKKDLIVHGKVKDLDKLVKVEQAHIIHIGKLENQREDMINQICGELGLEKTDITVSELSGKVGRENAAKLNKSRLSILNTIEKLKNENDINSKLIKNSLEYIDFSLNILSSLNSDGSYLKSGVVNEPGKRNIFDVRL